MIKHWQSLPQSNRLAAAVILMLTLVVITPLCGFLFQCGCDWPWQGLEAGCNFYQPQAPHKCPWCVSMLMGVVSTGIAIASGVMVALWVPTLWQTGTQSAVLMRILQGFAVFFVLALLLADIAAKWQLYPFGIGSV